MVFPREPPNAKLFIIYDYATGIYAKDITNTEIKSNTTSIRDGKLHMRGQNMYLAKLQNTKTEIIHFGAANAHITTKQQTSTTTRSPMTHVSI